MYGRELFPPTRRPSFSCPTPHCKQFTEPFDGKSTSSSIFLQLQSSSQMMLSILDLPSSAEALFRGGIVTDECME